VQEALARARRHGVSAVAESVAALHALLDAAALATGGVPAASHPAFQPVARVLDAVAARIGGDAALSASLLGAVADALEVEIERWERRARNDPDARAVLRALLGLREVLWEFGVRPPPPGAEPDTPPDPAGGPRKPARPPRGRVQRVRVEG